MPATKKKQTAKDLTFIRSQADALAWASLAVDHLVECGVLTQEDADSLRHMAQVVIAEARTDPKFIGQGGAIKRVEAGLRQQTWSTKEGRYV